MMIFILVYAESFKSISVLAYRVSFCCCRSKLCSDAFVNLFLTEFLTTWVHVEIVMCDSKLVIISIYTDRTLYIFCLLLTQFVLFTNYVFKQIIIYCRQLEFTQVKVITLGVEHYDYNTSCGNNNIRHNYSDYACLPSRVLKMQGADLNSIILWLRFFFFFYFIIINSFTFKLNCSAIFVLST